MIVFILKYWKFLLPAVLAISLAGGFLLYGSTKYRSGEKAAQEACKLKIERIAREQSQKAGQNKERIKDVEKNLDDAAIDNALFDLGIMRRNDDR